MNMTPVTKKEKVVKRYYMRGNELVVESVTVDKNQKI